MISTSFRRNNFFNKLSAIEFFFNSFVFSCTQGEISLKADMKKIQDFEINILNYTGL